MKQCMILCLLGLMIYNSQAQLMTRLSSMQMPVAGRSLPIVYNTSGTLWEDEQQVQVMASFYDTAHKLAGSKIPLQKKQGAWHTAIKIPAGTVLVNLVFVSAGDRLVDNNKGAGYLLPVYVKNMPAPYALYQMSNLVQGMPDEGRQLKKDMKQSLAYMKEEILYHATSEEPLRQKYYNLLANSAEPGDRELLVKKLVTVAARNEQDLVVAQLYLSFLGTRRQADSIEKVLLQRFPDGEYAQKKKLAPAAKPDTAKAIVDGMLDEPAPALALRDLNGQPVSLQALKGKTIVVDFWATWCKPCIASFPAIQQVMEKYSADPDVVFLFINTMEHGDAINNIKEFLQKKPLPFTILVDEKMENTNIYKAFSLLKVEGGIPYKLVIDKNGIIRFRSGGFNGDDAMLIKELTGMIRSVRSLP